MKIFVFGANGMLGGYVHEYLKGSVAVTRKDIDALCLRKDNIMRRLKMLLIEKDDVVINCMGITNKRNKDNCEFLIVNSLFPRLLADYCEERMINMIHVSTDCVFDGEEGYYNESHYPNSEDIYGLSKSLGDPVNCTVIRTSIIGENPQSSLDLLEWVRSHRNEKITGWANCFWNGITCMQFAKICDYIIRNNKYWMGVRHIHSPAIVNKAQLVSMINEIYELGNEIIVQNIDEGHLLVNRALISNYDLSEYDIPSIRDQIVEQKNFKP